LPQAAANATQIKQGTFFFGPLAWSFFVVALPTDFLPFAG